MSRRVICDDNRFHCTITRGKNDLQWSELTKANVV